MSEQGANRASNERAAEHIRYGLESLGTSIGNSAFILAISIIIAAIILS